jgi:2-oxoglutarate ferredoxin oxidoreductase subunit delta
MAGKIIIDMERCKGCTLCVTVCPKNVISISEKANSKGYFPAQSTGPDCTGCTNCAVVCPDCAIEVFRENNVVTTKSSGKNRSDLVSEK